MKRAILIFLFMVVGASATVALRTPAATADDAVIAADRTLMAAFEKGDKTTASNYLDADFTWVDPDGVLVEKEDALALDMKPLAGEGSDAEVKEDKIGDQVVWLHVKAPKKYVARLWVKRGSGWKLLHTTEIATRPTAEQISVRSTYPIPCINPCQKVPFKPADKLQAAALADWQQQISSREAYLTHVDDDQVLVTTYGGMSAPKKTRTGAAPETNPGPVVGSAPVLWMRMWTFAPDTVVMLACQPSYGQRAFWSSRVFHYQHGYWQMMESYHNTIQATGVMTEVEGK
jgi:hypothetical protein